MISSTILTIAKLLTNTWLLIFFLDYFFDFLIVNLIITVKTLYLLPSFAFINQNMHNCLVQSALVYQFAVSLGHFFLLDI